MLLDSANFLGFTFEIISIISFFAQGEMKNKPWLSDDKCWKKVLYENGTSDWTIKSICNCYQISNGMVFESNYFWWIICRFLERNYESDSFPGIFHVTDIIFKILAIVIFLFCLGELRSYFCNFCNHYVAST